MCHEVLFVHLCISVPLTETGWIYIQHDIIVVLRLWNNFADNYQFDIFMSVDGGWHHARYDISKSPGCPCI